MFLLSSLLNYFLKQLLSLTNLVKIILLYNFILFNDPQVLEDVTFGSPR